MYCIHSKSGGKSIHSKTNGKIDIFQKTNRVYLPLRHLEYLVTLSVFLVNLEVRTIFVVLFFHHFLNGYKALAYHTPVNFILT